MSMLSHLEEILPEAKPQSVLVIGDVILDEYLRGTVERISPEAPVPVVESATLEQAAGGAANVASNLARLGCRVFLCGIVGDDERGRALVQRLEEESVDTSCMVVSSSRPTTHKIRIVAQSQHVLRIDTEERGTVEQELVEDILARVTEMLPRVDGVILSDYLKGVLTEKLLERVIEAARREGKPVAVDPKGFNYERYRGVQVLTPNRHEVEQATGCTVRDADEMHGAVGKLLEITDADAVLATCGRDGMVLYSRDGKAVRIPAEAREVYDVTGAGDTVVAIFALGLFAGADLVVGARIANAAAGLVVGKLGTATITKPELSSYMAGRVGRSLLKIVELDGAVAVREAARESGRQVVFTNGCFDLLHAGHVHYLQAARDQGDLLIVGLNSDDSVRRNKGALRPLVGSQTRATVLAALECVDYVVFFDELVPDTIIHAIKPDVLVKGADYKPEEVVGRDTVEEAGGRLVLIDLVQGQSSTTLVDEIIRRHTEGG